MPTKRLTMRRIHRLMTMHFGAGAGTRVIARELGISHSTVREYLARIAAAGITWPLPAELSDRELNSDCSSTAVCEVEHAITWSRTGRRSRGS